MVDVQVRSVLEVSRPAQDSGPALTSCAKLSAIATGRPDASPFDTITLTDLTYLRTAPDCSRVLTTAEYYSILSHSFAQNAPQELVPALQSKSNHPAPAEAPAETTRTPLAKRPLSPAWRTLADPRCFQLTPRQMALVLVQCGWQIPAAARQCDLTIEIVQQWCREERVTQQPMLPTYKP